MELPDHLTPAKALNKAFRKVKPDRNSIELFKTNLIQLLDRMDENESEEFHKNAVSEFLSATYYAQDHYINTMDRKDLVIYNGKNNKSTPGVILETKKPGNKPEMPKAGNLNCKALQELLLYFMRERITNHNLDLKHLVVTDVYEWYIFDAQLFERLFAENKQLVKRFEDFEQKGLSGTKTEFFYKEIAAPIIKEIHEQLEHTYFDIRDYEEALRNEDKKDDVELVAPYKIFSPEHLLKTGFKNDSNSLDQQFYKELLHIIGLNEVKKGNKKLIERKPEKERLPGSLIENTYARLEMYDKIDRVENPKQYGKTRKEQLFNISLQLTLTWVNRILFLKLLEAQLLNYHKGDEEQAFLNSKKVRNLDDLDALFFQVLAKKYEERTPRAQERFGRIPYLNSSLFEPTELENQCITAANLDAEEVIPLHGSSVLTDKKGKRKKGEMNTLEYLFAFLGSYDFSSEGSGEIQEENKTLINASVLGLIFEKINGYKDGSFFTPGFITMYMCRQTIERAAVQKFNEQLGFKCRTYGDLREDVASYIIEHPQGRGEARNELNKLVNSIKICDPAVGSGHFLVSALNELIAVKHRLQILQDRKGEALRYEVEVVNDELIITNTAYEDEPEFSYDPRDAESRRIQEAMFHEKQTIIENCLFGVDINPNSVKICRLRLWIELLKSAYYTGDVHDRNPELETLPNIDINIKCGNSLISRFDLDADLSKALRSSKWNMDSYKLAVQQYRNAQDKSQKRDMMQIIKSIKEDFRTEISSNDPKQRRLDKLGNELFEKYQATDLFNEKLTKAQKADRKRLETKIDKLKTEINEIKNNKIYEDAFEWRFEFPEVLDNNGDFIGFDAVIGNPPYGRYLNIEPPVKRYLKNKNKYGRTGDIAEFFIKHISKGILNSDRYVFSFIVPKGLSYVTSWDETRELLLDELDIQQAIDTGRSFDEAAYEMMIFLCTNSKTQHIKSGTLTEDKLTYTILDKKLYANGVFFFGIPDNSKTIVEKLINNTKPVGNYYDYWYGKGGMTPYANKNKTGIKALKGKEVQKYFIRDIDDKWYIEDEHLNKLDEERINCEKVVVQDIVAHLKKPKPHIKLTATVDYDEQLCLNTVMCFKTKSKLSNEFLVGVINSKLMSFYFYYFVFNQAIRTMHFMPGYADRLPLIFNPELSEHISEKVKEVISIKKQDPSSDTSALEREIDELVYELYGLSKEEVKVVEEV